ncbi:MAG TPA: TetR/AcrR family transcriptional regulator [Acidimicrobiales bacterium]
MAQPMNAPRSRRLDPAARRAQILDAAAGLFRRRDPSGVRFNEVADAAGVSRSLVYAYFGDRGGLMAAVYLHSLRDVDAELTRLLRDVPIDEARLGTLVRRYLRLVDDNADAWRLFAAAGTLDHSAVQDARRGRVQRIADTWGGGGDARLLATGLIGLLEAAATEWLQHRPCTLEQASQLLARAMWHGLARVPLPGPGASPGVPAASSPGVPPASPAVEAGP